jgi:hypothetical protein
MTFLLLDVACARLDRRAARERRERQLEDPLGGE